VGGKGDKVELLFADRVNTGSIDQCQNDFALGTLVVRRDDVKEAAVFFFGKFIRDA